MKEVIFKDELTKVMIEAIDLLCNTVGSTLGPSGNNVLINTDDMRPYITNDGVSIATSIESDSKKINTVLEIAKEASLKTNEVVGDGTTTTLVLMQSIFKEGLKEIKNGQNPIVVKKELDESLNKVINEINQLKKEPSKKDFENVATISSGDFEIGTFLTKVFFKMQSTQAIRIEESHTEKTYYEIKKGYNLEIDNISKLYFSDNDEIVLNDSYILILNGFLESLEQIAPIINEALTRNKNIIVLASEFEDSLNQEVILYYLNQKKNIFLFKLPDYASRKEAIEDDIALLCGANIKNINFEDICFKDLGLSKEVVIKKDEIIILNDNKQIDKKIESLERKLKKELDDYEKEFLISRVAKLKKGIATIYVGATTKTEMKEKKMRFEDALCAIEMTSYGIVIGEGITLLKISDKIIDNNSGDKILKKALQVPFQKIMQNAGIDTNIKDEIKKTNYQKIYNFKTDKLEDIDHTKIIDPLKVVVEALKNATSIASMLLTTNYLIINENIKVERTIL